jgi:cell fate regulator YaaT (PSP1 superfamily)
MANVDVSESPDFQGREKEDNRLAVSPDEGKSFQLVEVKFRPEGRVYTFLASQEDIKPDDLVLVDTENGIAVGRVVAEPNPPAGEILPDNLRRVIRIASDEDLKQIAENRQIQQEAGEFFRFRVRHRELEMKLVEVECLFDRSKLIFYFAAEARVDFRELVKDLVQRFRVKIELRQIGARQEARLTKGLGICGRLVCCAILNRQSDRVSIKMAKEQNLSLNPEKISGICGRLMCCLAYEYETYCSLRNDVPRCNKTVETTHGKGKIIRQNVLKGEAVIQIEDGREVTLSFEELAKQKPGKNG